MIGAMRPLAVVVACLIGFELVAANPLLSGKQVTDNGVPWRTRLLKAQADRLVHNSDLHKRARSLLQNGPPECYWEPLVNECQLVNATAALPVGIFELFNSIKEKFDICFGAAEGPCASTVPSYCKTRDVPESWGQLCLYEQSQINVDADITELGYALEVMDGCSPDTDFGSKCMSALMVSLHLMGCDCDQTISAAHQAGTTCFSQASSTCPKADGSSSLNIADFQLPPPPAQLSCPTCICPTSSTASIVGGVLGGIIGLVAVAAAIWYCCFHARSNGETPWSLLTTSQSSQALERAPSRLDLGPTSAFVTSKGNERRFWFFGSGSSRNLNDMNGYPEVKLESSQSFRREPSIQYTTSNSLFANQLYYPQEREDK